VAADASRTKILGNFYFDYRRQIHSARNIRGTRGYSCAATIEIECDQKVWKRVGELIREHLSTSVAGSGSAAPSADPQTKSSVICVRHRRALHPANSDEYPNSTGMLPLSAICLRALSVLVKPVTRVELCRLVDPDKFVDPVQRVLLKNSRAGGRSIRRSCKRCRGALRTRNSQISIWMKLADATRQRRRHRKIVPDALRLIDVDEPARLRNDSLDGPRDGPSSSSASALTFLEALLFPALVAMLFGGGSRRSALVDRVPSAVASFLAHSRYSENLGWRADISGPQTRQGLWMFAAFIAAVVHRGIALGRCSYAEHFARSSAVRWYFCLLLLLQGCGEFVSDDRFLFATSS